MHRDPGELRRTFFHLKRQLSCNSSMHLLSRRNIDTVLLDLPSYWRETGNLNLYINSFNFYILAANSHLKKKHTVQPNKMHLLSGCSPWSTSLTTSDLVERHRLQSKIELDLYPTIPGSVLPNTEVSRVTTSGWCNFKCISCILSFLVTRQSLAVYSTHSPSLQHNKEHSTTQD